MRLGVDVRTDTKNHVFKNKVEVRAHIMLTILESTANKIWRGGGLDGHSMSTRIFALTANTIESYEI